MGLQGFRQILDKFKTMLSHLDGEWEGELSEFGGQGIVEDSAEDSNAETGTNSSKKATERGNHGNTIE